MFISKLNIYYICVYTVFGGKDVESLLLTVINMYKRFFDMNFIKYRHFTESNNKHFLKIIDSLYYNLLQNEVGVHKFIRVSPYKRNRIHTSTCIVEVYPEVILPKFSVLKKDLQIDTFKSSGPGGQHTNKTNSAVRIIHIPTGIKVECQNERSQSENKKLAINILVSKLNQYNLFTANRKVCLDRKVRVYSFSKSYVCNLLSGKKSFKLKLILNGRLDLIFGN